jgi:carbon monoxide dehydrogenase subunit G
VKYEKRVVINATPEEIWSLVEDLPTLATCIPGLEMFEMQDQRHFTSVVSIKVGPVQPRFRLSSTLTDLDPPHSLSVTSAGSDPALNSRVSQHQSVRLRPADGGTEVSIDLNLQISGRIATFGQRIIASKAEEFATQVITNVERVLKDRRGAGSP